MGDYLLVAMILKNKDDIDKIRYLEGIRSKHQGFIYDYFRMTHFRVLDTSSFSLLDISINEYCTGNFNIAGVSKTVK